nr:MAG TPA: hypothetical protein [Caudoviricetes sp.]
MKDGLRKVYKLIEIPSLSWRGFLYNIFLHF